MEEPRGFVAVGGGFFTTGDTDSSSVAILRLLIFLKSSDTSSSAAAGSFDFISSSVIDIRFLLISLSHGAAGSSPSLLFLSFSR